MKTQKFQYAIQTTLNMEAMNKLGFSMGNDNKNGWIYHAQASDEPLNIQFDSDNGLELSKKDDDEIIEAIVEKFDNSEHYEKLEFVAKLASDLAEVV